MQCFLVLSLEEREKQNVKKIEEEPKNILTKRRDILRNDFNFTSDIL